MAALWKQETSLHPTFQAFNNCLKADWFLLPFELKLQRAHAAALQAGGLISTAELSSLSDALSALEREYLDAQSPDSDAEDLHTWVESELTARAKEAGRKIHTARSRNDQVATLLKMYVIWAGERMDGDLAVLMEACCRRAQDWAGIPIVLHTHQQFAAPGNAGFWILRFAASFERIMSHVDHYLSNWRQYCPLGSGSVAGSSLPVDRRVQARELGFDAPSPNALESTGCRDECLEFLHLASQTSLHLQSFAADMILFSQSALSWVKYPAEFATGSSMMPNKMNPDAMELLRGEANAIHAAEQQALLLLKGLPSGYNRDFQCIKPIVQQTAERLHDLCEMTATFIHQLQFDLDNTQASMKFGAIEATLAMEEKVRAGMPLRDAHHATASAVKAGLPLTNQSPQELIEAYRTPGSASPEETRRAANAILERLHHPGPTR